MTSEAVQSMMVDEAKRLFKVEGKGVKVCVMSDSFNCDNSNSVTNAYDDVKSGDLPPFDRMEIFRDLLPTDPLYFECIDEGRAMMQLIHDIAPGADLGFYSAFIGLSAFADAVMELVDSGCHVIVDDILYFSEAWFQDDCVAQAVDYANDMGVPYFSAAGNFGRSSWEGEWQESPFRRLQQSLSKCGCQSCTNTVFNTEAGDYTCGERIGWKQTADEMTHEEACRFVGGEYPQQCGACNPDLCHDSTGSDFELSDAVLQFPDATDPTTDTFLRIAVSGYDTRVIMQWDDPKVLQDGHPSPQTDLDLYAFDAETIAFVSESIDYNWIHGFEMLIIPYPGTFDIVVERFSGPEPNLVKIMFDRQVFRDPTNGPADSISAGTVVGHANERGAIGVGAARFNRTPGFGLSPAEPEDFTAAGGVPVLFDTQGNRLYKPDIRQSPAVTAPDGTCTTFFGDQDPNDYNCYRFHGTSAAAPNAAAVAALMLEVQPRLQPQDVRNILQRTAEDMDSPYTPWFDHGYDILTGDGFVNALYAVAEAGMPLSEVKEGKGGKGKKSRKGGKGSGKGSRRLVDVFKDAKLRRRLEREDKDKPNKSASMYQGGVSPLRPSIERRRRTKSGEKTGKYRAKSFRTIRGA